MRASFVAASMTIAIVVAGCGTHGGAPDGSVRDDASASDASSITDAGAHGDSSVHVDAGATDSGATDSGVGDTGATDSGSNDSAPTDMDSRVDVGHDAASVAIDASSGGCISGAPGTMAVRFRWLGSGPGPTAYVSYEVDELPDTSRWHVSAADTSIGYTPVYDDTFLGEGGLVLDGSVFMDVDLSTAGTSVSSATIAIYGRSFDTTTSGSFSWQTFSGTGAAPTDLVSNVAPYQWYLADATSALPGGDGATLLRIYPGPSSNALIVDRVEICFAP